mgnify:CR=1 FL=1
MLALSNKALRCVPKFAQTRGAMSTEVSEYLKSKGYVADDLQEGMLDIFSTSERKVSTFENMGDRGLKALADAVERELVGKRARQNMPDVKVRVMFSQNQGGRHVDIDAKEGMNFYDLVQSAETKELIAPYMECACGGIAACSTCHVIIDDEETFAAFGEPEEAEMDMLDITEDVTPHSRLGCQLKFKPSISNISKDKDKEEVDFVVRLPEKVTSLW